MDNRMYAIREFYDVIFTAGHDLKIGETIIPAGDVVMYFSEVPRVQMQEYRTRVDAEGGYGNKDRVSWDETKGVQVNFSQGVTSIKHLAFLANAKLNKVGNIPIPEIERIYSDDFGTINLRYKPQGKVKIYSEGSDKVEIEVEERTVESLKPNTFYNVYYNRIEKEVDSLDIGDRWITGYLKMTAKAKMKDDKTGKTRTLFIEFPKVQVISELNMVLGSSNDVMSANFSVLAHPVGHRRNLKVGKFLFLGGE